MVAALCAQAACSALALLSSPAYRAPLLPLGLLCCAPQLRLRCGAALPLLLYALGGALLLANLTGALALTLLPSDMCGGGVGGCHDSPTCLAVALHAGARGHGLATACDASPDE